VSTAVKSDIAFVLGTRPEIIKLAPVIRGCIENGASFTLVHTGQHYSDRLDGVFFDDLSLPEPDHNLGVGSGSHGVQTGRILVDVEPVLLANEPDIVVVQGDTNSTLAGGLVASKIEAELAHVEAGLRSDDREMPEEINRRLVDHAADWLFAPTDDAAKRLRAEGIPEDRISVTGNTIVDAVQEHASLARSKSAILEDLGLEPGTFALLTAHRPGNVDDEARFRGILEGVGRYAERTGTDVVYPIHPRSADSLERFGVSVHDRIRLVEPLPFLDFLRLEDAASIVFTDSGGVQEETCILGTPCVTLRDNTERPETIEVGANVLVGASPDDVVAGAFEVRAGSGEWSNPFGDGTAAQQILQELGIKESERQLVR
jgi:UDP-N-acetylglucosamine 2-epimerase (non-hydrolysing)